MTSRLSVLFLCCSFIFFDIVRSQVGRSQDYYDRGFDHGYRTARNRCDQELIQARNNHQQALSTVQHQYDLKIAANQQDCLSNLTNEKSRCDKTCATRIAGITKEATAQCTKQLKDAKVNMNDAVIQNVRATISDLTKETRFCISFPESECRGQSSTCFWDASLKVTGVQRKGACIPTKFE